ncbi:MAG TPA: spore germination protein [Bacillota bacterium]|nr:spore germination protein [Bacillota bacterium]
MKQPKPLLSKVKKLKKPETGNAETSVTDSVPSSTLSSIAENFRALEETFGKDRGLIQATYELFQGKARVGVAYIKALADIRLISDRIVEPLLRDRCVPRSYLQQLPDYIQSHLITVPDTHQISDLPQAIAVLLDGNTVLFIEGADKALVIGTSKAEKRAIVKPDNEVTISADMDTFVEDQDTNSNLIMKRLPTADLQFETFTMGRLSHTRVKLVWLKGIANEKTIAEVRRRLDHIDIDSLDGIGMLASLIRDRPLSVFPTYKQTQRPDLTAHYLTDGRFGILCDNSPFTLMGPVTFWDNFKTMDDYSESTLSATYLRVSRIISFNLAILLSPLYLSFVTFNHSITPPALAVNIAKGREGVPLPSVLELLILTFSITIIREASVRISGSVGFFIGTLAAVVIGQASVTAGYVSASVIIVAAISAIASFAVSTPAMVYTARLTNFFLILLSSIFGMFGLFNGIVLILWHILTLNSFGMPYLFPLVPFSVEGLKDSIIRAPYSDLTKRWRLLAPSNRTRINKKKE